MATSRQHPHPSGQVVSVRLPPDIINRIDALVEHTGRSRGLYIRLALTAFLPQLEKDHWKRRPPVTSRTDLIATFNSS